MLDISRELVGVGLRLASERLRLGLSRAECGEIGGVNRDSQAAYEAGKRPCTVGYLAAIRSAGADTGYIVTGERSTSSIDAEAAELIDDWRRLARDQQAAVAGLVHTFACEPPRGASGVQGARHAYGAAPLTLPTEAALADAFQGVLLASEGMQGDELARELAKRLPIVLESAGDARPSPASVPADAPAAQDPAPLGEHRASGRARRR